MKIALLASRSFLAQALITEIKRQLPQAQILSYHREQGLDYPHKLPPLPALLDCEHIYYCAGAGVQSQDPSPASLIFGVNAFYPIQLLLELKAANYQGQFRSFGSYFEIGSQSSQELRDETFIACHNQSLNNPYAQSKNLFTRFLHQNQDPNNWPFCFQHFILNNIYGLGENPQRLLPYLFQAALRGQKLHFTSGQQIRQYTAVQDLAAYLIHYQNQRESGIFNLGQTQLFSVREVVELALTCLQQAGYQNFEIEFGPKSRNDQNMAFLGLDTQKIQAWGPWPKLNSLEHHLLTYLNFYSQNLTP